MFPYRTAEPNTLGQITRWDIPINRWLDVKFDMGLHDRGGAALGRMVEDYFADGPTITAQEANDKYALEGLKFDSPIKEERARLMHERKRAELAQMAYLEAAEHSWLSLKAAAGLGTSMFASMLHPVDVGLMFVPVVGSSVKAGGIAKLGGGALRQQLARGFVTRETLAEVTRFPQFTAAFIEGSVGNAIAEIPIFIQNVRDQAFYGPEDAVVNILAGGLFAAGIRLGLHGLSLFLESAAFVHRSLSPELKEAMFRKAVDDFARGKDIHVEDYVKIDESTIRSRVVFDEAKARQEAEGEVSVQNEIGDAERHFASYYDRMHIEDPDVPSGMDAPIVKTLRTIRESLETADKAEREGDLSNTVAALRRNAQAIREKPEVQKALADFRESKLTSSEAAAREQAVRELVEKKRAKFEAEKESLIEVERQAEVQRQQEQGKILPEEEIKRMQFKGETLDSKDAAIITEDLASIEQELKVDTERRLGEISPEEREALQRELDEELGQVEEKAYKPRDKAIEAAVPCVMEGVTRIA